MAVQKARRAIREVETKLQTVQTWNLYYSNRGQHTRWPRDWSSDVCSSDLARRYRGLRWRGWVAYCVASGVVAPTTVVLGMSKRRAEERRVGKECRSRWS